MSQDYIGRTFGDFAVRSRIGAGGAGVVYRAEQLALGREAVIKVLARQDEIDSGTAERFLREARLASRLDHPFAAHVYSFGAEPDGTLWIAMELVRGTPLNKLVTQGPIPLPRFVPFFDRLCEVLNAAHDQGIVHRDIKPANVMVLQRAGRLMPKLLDLGIARAATTLPSQSPSAPPTVAEAERLTGLSDETLSGSLTGRLTRSESMQLTHAGEVVGTPHYMAPEQWLDATRAGAPADVYSLAILAYQCLTGRLPFDGKSLRALARSHGTELLPPLGDGLPEALLEVLRKGAAKEATARHESPLAFAAALRSASGIGTEPQVLPHLEEGLRENVLNEAPQPLAEAVALLDAARTPRQGLEAARLIARVLSRFLGLLALSARVRIGAGAPSDAPEVRQLLQKLRNEGLSDREWLQLTCGLVHPFETKREAHPFSELVAFCAEQEPTSGVQLLNELLGFDDAPRSTESDALEALVKLVSRLGQVLERASFLFDYSLAVKRVDVERWMGTRRPRRIAQHTVHTLEPGEVVLADAEGATTSLLPFVQCSAPSGGAAEELFMLEGPGRHGARLVAWPTPYERQDEQLWDWLVQQGLLPPTQGDAVVEASRPYLGLSTFSPADSDNYFGREKEAEAFANRLRGEDFLAVVGPSGTGKSSFILAGVLALLPKDWAPLVLRPGATPMAALRARLEAEKLPSAGVDSLVDALGARTLLLVIDQFEELVTLCQDQNARLEFASTLLTLARHPSHRVKVVVTLRDDFLIKVQQLAPFRETLSNSLQLLGTPGPGDLQRVVTEPARRVGYAFDDATLPARMVEAVAEYPGALALLSFTASQLWDLRDRHLRLLRVKAYDALGGVGGALAHHAETTLASLNQEESGLVREAFRHLVTAQGTRAVLSRKEALEVLGGGAPAQSVLEKLVTARLLVSSETATGDDSIEIIHEALITAWPRLVGWQREDAEAARLRDALRAAARQWEDRGRPAGLLWRKETLAEYRIWRARFAGRLTQAEGAFADASLRDEAQGRLIRRVLASGAFVILLIGLVVIYRAYREANAAYQEADASSRNATERLQRLWQERGRLALVGGHPDDALIFSAAAQKAGASNVALDYLLAAAARQLEGMDRIEIWEEGGKRLLVSPDGQRAAVALLNEVAMIDLVEHRQMFRIPVRMSTGGSIRALAFEPLSGDVTVAGTATEDPSTSVVARYSRDGRPLANLRTQAPTISVVPLADGRIATTRSSQLQVLDLDGGITIAATKKSSGLSYFETQPGTGVVFLGPYRNFGPSAYFKVGFVEDYQERFETEAFPAPVKFVAQGSNPSQVVLARHDGFVSLLDLVKRKVLWTSRAHPGPILALAVDPATGLVVTTGSDRAARALDLATGKERFFALEWSGTPSCLATSGAAGLTAVGVSDGPVYLLDNQSGGLLWVHHGHVGSVVDCQFNGKKLLTLGEDGSLRIWDTQVRHQLEFKGLADLQEGNVLYALSLDGGSEINGQSVALPIATTVEGEPSSMLSSSATAWAVHEPGQLRLLHWDGGISLSANAPLPGDFEGLEISPSGSTAVAFLTDKHLHLHSDGGTQVFLVGEMGISGVFTSDESRWVTAAVSGTARIWSVATGEKLSEQVVHAGYFNIQETGVPNQFITMGYDRTVKEWRLEGNLLVKQRELRGLPEFPIRTTLRSDGHLLWLGYPSTLTEVYDFDSQQRLSSIRLGRPKVGYLRILKDGLLFLEQKGGVIQVPWPSATVDFENLLRCRIGVSEKGERVPIPADCFP